VRSAYQRERRRACGASGEMGRGCARSRAERGEGEQLGRAGPCGRERRGDGLGRTEPGLGRFGLMGLGFILFYFLFPISNTTQSKTI